MLHRENLGVYFQLYSTVTLRLGEKKHYNHKVDAYSFAIVLWELLHNKLPFEGMSNLQAAYAAAFKVRNTVFFGFFLSLVLAKHYSFTECEAKRGEFTGRFRGHCYILLE